MRARLIIGFFMASNTETQSDLPSAENTLMHSETYAASSVVQTQLDMNSDLIQSLIEAVQAFKPEAVMTCARGSSDHAATYAKYLIETHTGLLVSSAAPSISTVYSTKHTLKKVLFIAISQSGKSPDLVATAKAAKESGAFVLSFVNVTDSPLAKLADHVIPLRAGPELSVAATKSYIATLSALLHFVSEWQNHSALKSAHKNLPQELTRTLELSWAPAIDILSSAQNFYVIGRGIGFGIAQEAALKFKETCALHAEAFSAAEVKHGPMAIVSNGFPILCFSQKDETQAATADLLKDFTSRGAQVMAAGTGLQQNKDDGICYLPTIDGSHAATEVILFVQSFYQMVNALAIKRGLNPDSPPYLNKVTETF